MYIGRSGNLKRRWSSGHHRYHQAAKLRNPRLAWVLLSKSEISRAENAFIKQYQPAWNWTKVEAMPTWFDVWKLRLIALGVAAIAGICVGLLSLNVDSPAPNPTETQSPQ